MGRFGTSYISGGSSKLRCGAEAAARPGEARSTAASFFVAAAPGPARSVPPPGCGAARPSPLQICFCVLGTASVSPGRREQRAVWQPAWRAAAGTERGQPAPREPLAARRALRPVAADAWLARPGSACCSGAHSCAAEGRAVSLRSKTFERKSPQTLDSRPPCCPAVGPMPLCSLAACWRNRSPVSRRPGSAPRARIAPCRAQPARLPPLSSRSASRGPGTARAAVPEVSAGRVGASAGVRPQRCASPRGITDRDTRCSDSCRHSAVPASCMSLYRSFRL